MAKKVAFTPVGIDALKSGEKLADPNNRYLVIEALSSGKRVWKYRRRAAGGDVINARLGLYPHHTIADARKWAAGLNESAVAGVNPVKAKAITSMTVDQAHALYMEAVERNDHKVTRTKRNTPLKQRTKDDKIRLYTVNVSPVIGSKPIVEVTNADLNGIIIKMSVRAPVQADRTGAEMRVFWGWARGIRGRHILDVEIENDPTSNLAELWNGHNERTRWLDHDELPLFLKALAQEPERHHRRALLLLLLTGCRAMEVLNCPASDVRDGMLIVTADRAKNGQEHPIKLGPWGAALAVTNEPFLITSPKLNREGGVCPMVCGWPKVIERVRKRMEVIGSREVEHFTPHDLRRTMRSHVEDHGVDEVLAERMMNHLPKGLVKTYMRNKRAEAMAAGFLAWENALAAMAMKAGVARKLDIPVTTAAEPQAIPQPLAA